MVADYMSTRSEIHARESGRLAASGSAGRAVAEAGLAQSRMRLAQLETEIVDYVVSRFVGPEPRPRRQD